MVDEIVSNAGFIFMYSALCAYAILTYAYVSDRDWTGLTLLNMIVGTAIIFGEIGHLIGSDIFQNLA